MLQPVRDILNTIKSILGVSSDAELARRIDVPVHTLRSWIQNNSIRRQLLEFCVRNTISLDEALCGVRIYSRERCEPCAARHTCPAFTNRSRNAVIVNERAFGSRHIVINTTFTDRLRIDMYAGDTLQQHSEMSIDTIDKIVLALEADITE